MSPSDVKAQLRQISSLMQGGDLERAGTRIARLKKTHPLSADLWALDSEIAVRQRRLTDAIEAIDQAVALEPDNPNRHIQRARCCVLTGDTDGARESAFYALRFDIRRLDYLLVLGGVLVRCDEHDKALPQYLRAEEISNTNADVHRGLASVYRFLGRADEAETAANRAIELDPHDYETIGLRSSLRMQTPDSNHVDELVSLRAGGVKHWRGAVHLDYALAKEYEDLQRYEESFSALQRGAAIKRKFTKYDLADDLKIFDRLRETFTPDTVSRLAGSGLDDDAPIFVLGMPRTGSTLIERIISSHSEVQNAGELSTFSVEMMRMVSEKRGGKSFERRDLPRLASELPLCELGERYLTAVESVRKGKKHFVDKLPLNSLNIGLIFGALPNAKVIHVIRDPMDACYAMYKYLFKNGYPFSYDLEELAAYYAEYFQLMQHWREVLPDGWIYDIRYEDVVADLPGEARKLIQRLGLAWEESCELFHMNQHASTTGSASQVRKPVYGSSVGKWRNFERQLRPLRDSLERSGVVR